MTREASKKIRVVVRDIPKNARRISAKLKRLGTNRKSPAIYSAAKYYEALKKLAQE